MGVPDVGGVTVRIDPTEWYRLKQALDGVDKRLTTALRKRVKNAGNVAAEAVIKALKENPPPGAPDPEGMREALQKATKVSLSFGARAAGVKVKTMSTGLPFEQKPLLAAYNKVQFRHPVFADASQPRTSWRWVPQIGRPYFGASIEPILDGAIQDEIRAALDDAVAAIGGKVL